MSGVGQPPAGGRLAILRKPAARTILPSAAKMPATPKPGEKQRRQQRIGHRQRHGQQKSMEGEDYLPEIVGGQLQ